MTQDYPVNYDKTLAQAKRQVGVGLAISNIDEIEERWVRVTSCEEYSLRDLKKEILLTDICDLLKSCVVLINKIAELEALVQHRNPRNLLRIAKKIALPLEDK